MFDSARAVGYDQGVLVEAIQLFKYKAKTKLSRYLAAGMCGEARKMPEAQGGLEVVLPMPLHPTRLRHREFNLSLLLAHELSRELKVPLLFDALERSRWPRLQAELEGEEQKRMSGRPSS